jgi:hypothetical protein
MCLREGDEMTQYQAMDPRMSLEGKELATKNPQYQVNLKTKMRQVPSVAYDWQSNTSKP